MSKRCRLICGDALKKLPKLRAGSVDAVITDPPYPGIQREYGYWTEAEWFALMRPLVAECRRLLKPTGSAVFILQPNSQRVGRMRTWLWEFMSWIGKTWGIIQDAWWWNPTCPPTVHVHRKRGGMRPSVKACVWAGAPDCFRNQDAVLWTPSDAMNAQSRTDRALRRHPSGLTVRAARVSECVDARGGVTPFNLLPIPTDNFAGINGHPAGTPAKLCEWWIKYIVPRRGVVLDPFAGSGTVPLAAQKLGHPFIGIERDRRYFRIAQKRLATAERQAA